MSFITPQEVADLTGQALGYINYLRTAKAKTKGHIGPPWYTVEDAGRFGTANPRRIKYLKKDVETWVARRKKAKAERQAAAPKLTRHSN